MPHATKPAGSSWPTVPDRRGVPLTSPVDGRVIRGHAVPEAPDISICILVMDDVERVLECLNALRRPRSRVAGMEIVVVANGTPAGSLGPLESCDDIVVVVNEVNLGFAAGCNQAVAVTQAPLLLFLNDDSLVEDGCVDALMRAILNDPCIGAVGSRIMSVDGAIQEAGSIIWRDGSATHVGEGMPGDSDMYLEPRWVDYSSANGLLVLRSAWDAVGGFDDRYFPAYYEDVDFCLSLASRGFRTRYEPTAVLVHRGSQSTSTVLRDFLLMRNQRQLVEKWGGLLERFDPPPEKESGPEFDAAVDRAVQRAEDAGPRESDAPSGPSPPVSRHVPFDPQLAADDLAAAYVSYLEERVVAGDRRVRALESYLTKLWNVRLRRWVGRRLPRHRSDAHRTTTPDALESTVSVHTRPESS